MRLQDKFKRVFVFPLMCGISISIISTVAILIYFSKVLPNSEIILNKNRKQVDLDTVIPVIESFKLLLFKKFQASLNSLDLISKYYKFYVEILNNQINETLINQYCINALKINENQARAFEDMRGDKKYGNIDIILDYSFWAINNRIKEFDSLKNFGYNDTSIDHIKKQLTVFTSMIQVFHSLIQTIDHKEPLKYYQLYVVSKKTKLLFAYPLIENEFYNEFNYTLNPSYCKNSTGITPNYYYFECRPWYYQATEFFRKYPNDTKMITTPYFFSQNSIKNGITVCAKTKDYLYKNDDNDNFLLWCIDLSMDDILLIGDHFNLKLKGYFFAMRVDALKPVYHPSMLKKKCYLSIPRFEFNNDTSYYFDEYQNFNEIVLNLTKRINNTIDINRKANIKPITGNYSRDGKDKKYILYPIMFYTEIQKILTFVHYISVIYVYEENDYLEPFQKISQKIIPKIIIQFLLFSGFGIILLVVAYYLIVTMAKNIIKPIKNLKIMIKGMEFDLKDNSYVNSSMYRQISKDDEEIDEEILDVRSEEIEELFNVIIKLRNVFSFTSRNVENEIFYLVNYIEAKYAFKKDFSNTKGNKII